MRRRPRNQRGGGCDLVHQVHFQLQGWVRVCRGFPVRVSTGLQRVCSAGAFIYLAVTMVLMLLFLRLSVQWPAVVGALKRLERRLVVGEYPFIDLRPRIRITTIVVLSANFLSEHSISKTYKGSVLRNTNILCPPQLK